MSVSTTPAAGSESDSNTVPTAPSKWVPPEERPPTEAQEAQARKQSLEEGNRTEIAYDSEGKVYDPRQLSYRQRQRYAKLDKHNRDNHWKNRDDIDDIGGDYDRQLKLKTTQGIASQLGLSKFHTQVVVDRIFEIDGQRFGQRNEAVAFCLCAVVVNEDARDRYDSEKVYHPARGDANNDSQYVRMETELIEAFDPITKSRLQSIYSKLTQGTPPTKVEEETSRFVADNSVVQRNSSFAPDYALPQSSGDQ